MIWSDLAECKRWPNINFFPEAGESQSRAKDCCARCPVRVECLEFALACEGLECDRVGRPGIFGGTNARERQRIAALRRSRRRRSGQDFP